MAQTPTATSRRFVNTIFEDALAVARDTTLAPGLVRVFTDATGMALRKNQEYGTATINEIAETDDLVSQVFTPTALSTLTPYEYGAQFLLTDQRMESDPFGVRQDAALELGGAMAATALTALLERALAKRRAPPIVEQLSVYGLPACVAGARALYAELAATERG